MGIGGVGEIDPELWDDPDGHNVERAETDARDEWVEMIKGDGEEIGVNVPAAPSPPIKTVREDSGEVVPPSTGEDVDNK